MKYDHTKASWRACQLSWCLALSLRHARWHDLAVAEYPRPPSEAYSERDAPLKPCQIILLGVYQSKSPLGRSHCITVDAIPRRGNLNVRTVIIRHPVSGTLGKQTCSELTQSVKHWEAQTPLSKVKIPFEKVPLLTQSPGKAGGITDPHTARRFTRMRVWLWNGKHPLRRCSLMLSVKWWPFLSLKDQGLTYFFLLPNLLNCAFSQSYCTECRKKLCSNPLAWLVILLELGHRLTE